MMLGRRTGLGVSRILGIAAVVLFVLAAFGVSLGTLNLLALGLACLAAALVL